MRSIGVAARVVRVGACTAPVIASGVEIASRAASNLTFGSPYKVDIPVTPVPDYVTEVGQFVLPIMSRRFCSRHGAVAVVAQCIG